MYVLYTRSNIRWPAVCVSQVSVSLIFKLLHWRDACPSSCSSSGQRSADHDCYTKSLRTAWNAHIVSSQVKPSALCCCVLIMCFMYLCVCEQMCDQILFQLWWSPEVQVTISSNGCKAHAYTIFRDIIWVYIYEVKRILLCVGLLLVHLRSPSSIDLYIVWIGLSNFRIRSTMKMFECVHVLYYMLVTELGIWEHWFMVSLHADLCSAEWLLRTNECCLGIWWTD